MLSGSVCLSLSVAACHALINIKHKAIVVFKNICSPPARSPIMVAKEIGLELELKWVMNRGSCVPLLHSGFSLKGNWFHQFGAYVGEFHEGREKGAQNVERRAVLKLIQLTDQSGSNHSDFGRWRRCYLWQVGPPDPRHATGWISKGRGASLLCAYLSPSHLHAIGVVSFIPPCFLFSHAINLYLIEKYAPDDYLYPKHDFLLRTAINDRLFFDAGFLFPRGLNLFVSIWPRAFFDESRHNELLFSFPYWCRGSLRFRRTSP